MLHSFIMLNLNKYGKYNEFIYLGQAQKIFCAVSIIRQIVNFLIIIINIQK